MGSSNGWLVYVMYIRALDLLEIMLIPSTGKQDSVGEVSFFRAYKSVLWWTKQTTLKPIYPQRYEETWDLPVDMLRLKNVLFLFKYFFQSNCTGLSAVQVKAAHNRFPVCLRDFGSFKGAGQEK